LTLNILRQAKRFHVTVSFIADTNLKESLEKGMLIYSVASIYVTLAILCLRIVLRLFILVHKYNLLMKDFPINELLSAPDINKVKESLIAIFNHLKKLRLS
jgi:dynein heavy chain 1, cytosolic